jgi:hypothetical protein
MDSHDGRNPEPATPRNDGALHPRVYGLLVGLVLWLVVSVWLFAAGGTVDYLLVIVSAFILLALALPLIMWRVGRADGAAATKPLSYRDWAAADFDTWQGKLRGKDSAVLIALPIAAVAIGMTLFGIAYRIAEHSGPLKPPAAYSSGSVVKNNG